MTRGDRHALSLRRRSADLVPVAQREPIRGATSLRLSRRPALSCAHVCAHTNKQGSEASTSGEPESNSGDSDLEEHAARHEHELARRDVELAELRGGAEKTVGGVRVVAWSEDEA